jgi:uncharacterized protein
MDAHAVVTSLFGSSRALIGVIHVAALPGTPGSKQGVHAIAAAAVLEAQRYADAGFHGVMIENTHDRPYLRERAGPEVTAAMAVVGAAIVQAVSIPLGVQILAGANTEALAVAHACGAKFVRVEGFVFAHVADEGLINASAGPLLRYRRTIGAESIRVFADIKKKHSAHSITADVGIAETAKAAEFFLVDGVIVSGIATGEPAEPAEVASVSSAVRIPTLVGSGINPENIGDYREADALIVGSWIKRDGIWSNPLDVRRVRILSDAFRSVRAS